MLESTSNSHSQLVALTPHTHPHPRAHTQVFVGMFVTFGLLRFPTVIRSVVFLLGHVEMVVLEHDVMDAMDVLNGFMVRGAGWVVYACATTTTRRLRL